MWTLLLSFSLFFKILPRIYRIRNTFLFLLVFLIVFSSISRSHLDQSTNSTKIRPELIELRWLQSRHERRADLLVRDQSLSLLSSFLCLSLLFVSRRVWIVFDNLTWFSFVARLSTEDWRARSPVSPSWSRLVSSPLVSPTRDRPTNERDWTPII